MLIHTYWDILIFILILTYILIFILIHTLLGYIGYSYKTNIANADERVDDLTFLDEFARLNFSTTIEFNNGTSLRGFCTNCLDVDDDIGFTLIYPGSQGGGARIKYYEGLRAGIEVVHQF